MVWMLLWEVQQVKCKPLFPLRTFCGSQETHRGISCGNRRRCSYLLVSGEAGVDGNVGGRAVSLEVLRQGPAHGPDGAALVGADALHLQQRAGLCRGREI